ncbi:MAG: SRPBCC domain-containing protein [Ignavibacteriales bacterium]
MEPGIKLTAIFQVSAKKLYDSWLNSQIHSSFTGSKAHIEPKLGSHFTAWNGYIKGINLILQPYGRIVQSWRTNEFPEGVPDSKVEILFEKHNSGTKLTIVHTQLPGGDEKKYEKGWKEHYFKPMKFYFQKMKSKS